MSGCGVNVCFPRLQSGICGEEGVLCQWCKIAALESRVRELEAKCFNLEAEREPLIHDLERHIAIAAREADARIKAEAALESREPSKSQVKRISAMVESAEIKRLEAERDRLREALEDAVENVLDWGDYDLFLRTRAALKG